MRGSGKELKPPLPEKRHGSFSYTPPPPTSHEHQFYGVTSSFTRLIMKTKYVSPHANFHNDRTMRTVTLLEKIASGGKENEPMPLDVKSQEQLCLE